MPTPYCIIIFVRIRCELRYAEDRGDWILYDNTGLKGDVSEWCKSQLETGKTPVRQLKLYKDNGDFLNPDEELRIYKQEGRHLTHMVYAIGFERNKLPHIFIDQRKIPDAKIKHDACTGQLLFNGEKLPNIFGYGIAFPEKVVDPCGNHEEAVGMWKFMRYISEVIAKISSKN